MIRDMGGISVNDRAVGVPENYEIEVLRTWKGRGAILCESDKGLLILKEYTGPKSKIIFQDALLKQIKEQGFPLAESILKTKENDLIVYDQDRVPYILKTYFEGRECNVRDIKECRQAVKTLARLHKASHMDIELFPGIGQKAETGMDKEYEKHNRELRKVRKFLKDKSQKTNFEIFLLKHYDYFFDLALRVTEESQEYTKNQEPGNGGKTGGTGTAESCIICHGDYQHHNILVTKGDGDDKEEMAVINFEKCIRDNPVRDLYLFMRKLLEKGNWSIELGNLLLETYHQERELTQADYRQLYYRFIYPEKFWKIVNFYYNSGKSWIPGRNLEKMEKLLAQEENKTSFLENYKSTYGCFSFSSY